MVSDEESEIQFERERPRAGHTWKMIWSLIRLMAMRILAIVAGRDI